MAPRRVEAMKHLALLVGIGCLLAGSTSTAGLASPPQVTVLKVFEIGDDSSGRPEDHVGQHGKWSGQLRDATGNLIGHWHWNCEYLGGYGSDTVPSHFCTFTSTFGNRGSITTAGGLSTISNAPFWQAITHTTGAFRGTIGTMELADLNQPNTTLTYYLIRR
jgi:Allene oxide cyclase barrel like domain